MAFTEHGDSPLAAVCDVTGANDYSAFYYRKPAGRNIVTKFIRDHYAGQKATEGYAPCAKHIDFREMLVKNLPIEALLDSDWTMANPRLCEFYGLPEPKTSGFQRVALRKLLVLDAAEALDDLRIPPSNRGRP